MKPTPKYASRPASDDPRDVEAWALAEAARRLIDAGHNADKNPEALQAALQLNQRLWTIFQAAMTEDDCPHPHELRTNIAALSLMVDRETMARLADLDGTKLDVLVNINRNVAGGLLAQKENGAAAAIQATQPSVATAPAPPPQAPRPAAPATPEATPVSRESLRISI
ncbi:flagellar biosynthesis regulator FlaF [Azospirillum sp.]|uniref:flagellar biosynthesis regulator FlaF n=1 Tax=Azospirillum sp. TaxID=34012 RepID=UPI002D58BD59|nr:flagellar biosynthesis regulator FlaF [Azospirillum sp.]HYD68327.1 flagellar biosynthesis regulator FlaF [Azospirillum sp.]